MLRNEKAMTIIEVIVALAILSIVIVGTLNMFKFSFSILSSTEKENLALYFAQEKLEEAKVKIKEGIDPSKEKTEVALRENFEINYQVESIILDSGLRELKVTVDYGPEKVVLKTRVGTDYAQ
ncbi:MAG: type II secretion system protein [Clostridia bacterium]|jgi:type II secretion system protein I|nr:type II secretion system protein [Clostridia bacterium]